MRTELYRHWDKDGNLLYVGISKSTMARLCQHAENAHWYERIVNVTIERFPTRAEAEAAERAAIKAENPLHNKQRFRDETPAERKARIEESRADLLRRVVRFNPLYTVRDAADFLSIRPKDVTDLIASGELASARVPSKKSKFGYNLMVTGWQMIDYVEKVSVEREAA